MSGIMEFGVGILQGIWPIRAAEGEERIDFIWRQWEGRV
jgi:hypothetical protein